MQIPMEVGNVEDRDVRAIAFRGLDTHYAWSVTAVIITLETRPQPRGCYQGCFGADARPPVR